MRTYLGRHTLVSMQVAIRPSMEAVRTLRADDIFGDSSDTTWQHKALRMLVRLC